MDETEVLRISGNVTIMKGESQLFIDLFMERLLKERWIWSGNIVPQDSPTGMRLYRVEEVEGYKVKIEALEMVHHLHTLTEESKDKAFLSLSEELTKEQSKNEQMRRALNKLDQKCVGQDITIDIQSDKIAALELRLKLKSNLWRALAKWWNRTFNKRKNAIQKEAGSN